MTEKPKPKETDENGTDSTSSLEILGMNVQVHFMLGNRGGIAPTVALFYPRNVCLLFNKVALYAICTGLVS